MINGHLRLAKVTFRHTQKRESRGKWKKDEGARDTPTICWEGGVWLGAPPICLFVCLFTVR